MNIPKILRSIASALFVFWTCTVFAGNGAFEILTTSDWQTTGCSGSYSDKFIPPLGSPPVDKFYLGIRLLDNNLQPIPLVATNSNGFDAGTGLVTGTTALAARRSNYYPGYPENWNYYSAFQLGCSTAGSFINTWTWPQGVINGGGPNAVYQIDFSNPKPVFDANYNELWLQADSISLPYITTWGGIGQIVLAAFIEYTSATYPYRKQTFQILSELYDSRPNHTYDPVSQFDTAVHNAYATAPNTNNRYMSSGPVEYGFSPMKSGLSTWNGARFRAQISRSNFVEILNDINNTVCPSHRDAPDCQENFAVPNPSNGNDSKWAQYKLKIVFMLNEVFYTGYGNIAMGMNVQGLGAYRYARPGVN